MHFLILLLHLADALQRLTEHDGHERDGCEFDVERNQRDEDAADDDEREQRFLRAFEPRFAEHLAAQRAAQFPRFERQDVFGDLDRGPSP